MEENITLTVNSLAEVAREVKRGGDPKFHPKELRIPQSSISKFFNVLADLQLAFTPRDTSPADFDAFIAWFRSENPIAFEHLKIASDLPEGNGIIAERDFQESESVMRVPLKLMMSHRAAMEDPFLQRIIKQSPFLNQLPLVVLAIFLLFEKKKKGNSFWEPYISCLPKKYSTCLYLTLDDLIELEGSLIQQECMKAIVNSVMQYTHLYSLLKKPEFVSERPELQHISFEEFRWALSTVQSRHFKLPAPHGEALIPGWDLFNHSPGKISYHFDATNQRLECYAQSDFQEGQQITIFYGDKGNAELFQMMGFLVPDNLLDYVKVKVPILEESEKLRNLRINAMQTLQIDPEGVFKVYLINTGNQQIQTDIFDFIKITVLDIPADLVKKPPSVAVYQILQLSNEYDNQRKACEFMQEFISTVLKLYPTTLEDDLELRKNRPSLVLEYRLMEKKILTELLAQLELVKDRLKDKKKEKKKGGSAIFSGPIVRKNFSSNSLSNQKSSSSTSSPQSAPSPAVSSPQLPTKANVSLTASSSSASLTSSPASSPSTSKLPSGFKAKPKIVVS